MCAWDGVGKVPSSNPRALPGGHSRRGRDPEISPRSRRSLALVPMCGFFAHHEGCSYVRVLGPLGPHLLYSRDGAWVATPLEGSLGG